MGDEEGRREVRGMMVRGMILKTFFPIPLTIIALTLVVRQGPRYGKMTALTAR
jgi:hypothetical protein